MIRHAVRGAVAVALLGAWCIHAEELRVTTSFRTGTLTDNVGAANFIVRDVAGDAKPEIISCATGAAFAVSFDGTTYGDVWYSPDVDCTAVTVADRQGNGLTEVIVGTGSYVSYSQYRGFLYAFDPTHYGTATAMTQVSDTEALNDVAVGDVDGDSNLEVVAVTNTKVYVLDARTFVEEWRASYGGHTVAIADLENDGGVEIIIAGTDGHVINGATHTYKWGYAGGFGTGMAVGDVDNDAKPEIVGGAVYGGVKVVNGDTMTTVSLSSLRAEAVAVGDGNNDGQNEIIVGEDQWGSVMGYNVAGTKLWNVSNPEHGVMGIGTGDPDGDGTNEVIWGAGASSSGEDVFFVADALTDTYEFRAFDLDGPYYSAIGDLDGDGDLELVVTTRTTSSAYDAGAITIYDYDTHALITRFLAPGDTRIADVAIGQVDSDPAREIVILGEDWYDGFIHVYDGVTHTKEWSSPAPVSYNAPGPSTAALIVNNIDADSVDEIIYTTTDSKVQVLNGASEFIQYTTGVLDSSVTDLALADVDDDSVPDLVAGTQYGAYVFKTSDWSELKHLTLASTVSSAAATNGHIAFAFNNGQIAVYSGNTFDPEWSCSSLFASDVGFVTLGGEARLAVPLADGTLRFYPMDGTTCPVPDTISTPVGPTSAEIQFTDVTGDGEPELLASGTNGMSISMLGWSSDPRGDADGDGIVTDADMDALAAHFYGDGSAQPAADVNGDGTIRPDDLFFLINYRRGTGEAPPQ